MRRKLYVGAIAGAVVSLVMIPVGLAEALPVLTPMCCLVSAGIAGLIYLVGRPSASGSRRLRLFDEITATDNALVLGLTMVLAVRGIVPSVLQAREAARRTMVRNSPCNFSHACHGNLVRLDESMRVVGISLSGCALCRIVPEHSPFSNQPFLAYVDATGHRISSGDVPADVRRAAGSRFRYLESQRANGWWDDPRPFPAGTYFVPADYSRSSAWRSDNGRVFVRFVN